MPCLCLPAFALAADSDNDSVGLGADCGDLLGGHSDFWPDERQASMHSADRRDEEWDFIRGFTGLMGYDPTKSQ